MYNNYIRVIVMYLAIVGHVMMPVCAICDDSFHATSVLSAQSDHINHDDVRRKELELEIRNLVSFYPIELYINYLNELEQTDVVVMKQEIAEELSDIQKSNPQTEWNFLYKTMLIENVDLATTTRGIAHQNQGASENVFISATYLLPRYFLLERKKDRTGIEEFEYQYLSKIWEVSSNNRGNIQRSKKYVSGYDYLSTDKVEERYQNDIANPTTIYSSDIGHWGDGKLTQYRLITSTGKLCNVEPTSSIIIVAGIGGDYFRLLDRDLIDSTRGDEYMGPYLDKNFERIKRGTASKNEYLRRTHFQMTEKDLENGTLFSHWDDDRIELWDWMTGLSRKRYGKQLDLLRVGKWGWESFDHQLDMQGRADWFLHLSSEPEVEARLYVRPSIYTFIECLSLKDTYEVGIREFKGKMQELIGELPVEKEDYVSREIIKLAIGKELSKTKIKKKIEDVLRTEVDQSMPKIAQISYQLFTIARDIMLKSKLRDPKDIFIDEFEEYLMMKSA